MSRAAAAVVLALALAGPAGAGTTGDIAAHLQDEAAECTFLLGLCRAAAQAADRVHSDPRAEESEGLAARHQGEATLTARDALDAGRVIKEKHGGKKLACFDDPACAFVKAALWP
jgi:hypothetical protein